MLKYISSAMVCPLFIFFATAQPVPKKKPVRSFQSIFLAGIVEGQADKTFAQLQSVNGIKIRTWFAGMGLGIDYYGAKRSIPLFAAIQKDVKENKKTPFAYGNAGYNFSWLRNKEKIVSTLADYSQSGGLFYELGLGYKFLLKNKMYLGLSAGYSYKQQSEKIVSQQFCVSCVPRPVPPIEEFEYKFRRVSIKMNCWF
jgi:hypothetical protein